MRVLLLESGTGPGGSISFLRDFVFCLDRTRVKPFVGLYSPNPSVALNEIRSLGVPICFFGNPTVPPTDRESGLLNTRLRAVRAGRTIAHIAKKMLAVQLPQALRVARFMRKNRIEVALFNQDIHLHLPGVLAARLTHVPCICRKAGGIGEGERIKRVVTPWVDLFVSVSKATEEDQRKNLKTRRLVNIYEGVDLDRFQALPARAKMRSEFGVPEGKKVVAAISRIETGKGHPEFLRMAAEVLRHDPNVVFLLVGDQDHQRRALMAQLKALSRELGISNSVIFTGWRDDIPAVMNAVDVFVHCPTTWIEGLGIACLEAMAMGLPAVVSNNGGLPDSVVDGETGFVVPVGDSSAMAGAVMKLLREDDLRRTLGLNARLRAQQMFSMSKNARRLQDVLIECARARRLAKRRTSSSIKADAA